MSNSKLCDSDNLRRMPSIFCKYFEVEGDPIQTTFILSEKSFLGGYKSGLTTVGIKKILL